MENIPKHIAVIPDGNRRWAKKRKLQPWKGHQEGANNFEKVLEKALELKITYFTLWASSWDNLTERSRIEVNFLFKVYDNIFQKLSESRIVHGDKVKISVLGRWKEILPQKTQNIIEKTITATKNYDKFFLTLLLAYNGTDEIIDCIQNIVDKSKNKQTKIDGELIKENLWTRDLPPVDLLIRTGCEEDPHLSAGFMMWDVAYAQLYFSKTYLPDFGPKEFEEIIENYSCRKRRMGA